MCLLSNVAEEVGAFDDESDNPVEGDDALNKVINSLCVLLCMRCSACLVYSRNYSHLMGFLLF